MGRNTMRSTMSDNIIDWAAYEQGRYACKESRCEKCGHIRIAKNPYPVSSDKWKFWNRGWNSFYYVPGEAVTK
jgi:hypothetical protein